MRLRRSELATPGSSEKMITKAAASGADLVFLDLEDAVAPAQKAGARHNIVRGLNDLDWGRTLRAVRVNGAHTEWAHEDVITVVEGAGANIDVTAEGLNGPFNDSTTADSGGNWDLCLTGLNYGYYKFTATDGTRSDEAEQGFLRKLNFTF